MSNYPRRADSYELFTYGRKTYSFDDPGCGPDPAIVDAPDEMWEWLRSQPGCRPLYETDNTAFYLNTQTYILWKLRWL